MNKNFLFYRDPGNDKGDSDDESATCPEDYDS